MTFRLGEVRHHHNVAHFDWSFGIPGESPVAQGGTLSPTAHPHTSMGESARLSRLVPGSVVTKMKRVRCCVVTVRAIRGATQLETDEARHLLERTGELMQVVLERNELDSDNVISVLLTVTPDLRSAFPAAAVRALGITDVPMMCAQEIDVPGAMPRVVRLMAHVETSRPRAHVRHVYLHGTSVLRDDIAEAE